MHGHGAANVRADMVWVDVFTYSVSCAYVAGMSGMDVRHLYNHRAVESRMVALRLNPVDGRIFDIVCKYICTTMLSFYNHKVQIGLTVIRVCFVILCKVRYGERN